MPPAFVVRPVLRADHTRRLSLRKGYNLFYERVGPAAIPPAVTQANGSASSTPTSRCTRWWPSATAN